MKLFDFRWSYYTTLIVAILLAVSTIPATQAAIIITPKTTIESKSKVAKKWLKKFKTKQIKKHPKTIQTGEDYKKKKFPWFAVICWSVLGVLLALIIVGGVLGIPAMWISATVILSSLIVGLFLMAIFLFKILRH